MNNTPLHLLPGWETRACEGMSLDLFYGPDDEADGGYAEPQDQRLWREKRAKAICAGCPFQVECLEDELANVKPFAMWGVRGGMTAPERRGLLRRRHAAARAAERAAS